MKIKVQIKRSTEWLWNKRIEVGDNVPQYLPVEVDVSNLSSDARAVLLAAGGDEYRDLGPAGITYNAEFKIRPGQLYGKQALLVDADSPSIEQIDAAILAAAARVEDRRQEEERRMEERLAKRAADEMAKQERERKLEEARNLLKDDLELLERHKAYRATLSDILACVPKDALRGAIRREAEERNGQTVDDVTSELYAACVHSILDD